MSHNTIQRAGLLNDIWSNIQYSKHELRPQKIQLLNEKSSTLKKYIKVSDALWDALMNNHVLSQFEVMEFQVSYKESMSQNIHIITLCINIFYNKHSYQ